MYIYNDVIITPRASPPRRQLPAASDFWIITFCKTHTIIMWLWLAWPKRVRFVSAGVWLVLEYDLIFKYYRKRDTIAIPSAATSSACGYFKRCWPSPNFRLYTYIESGWPIKCLRDALARRQLAWRMRTSINEVASLSEWSQRATTQRKKKP